MSVLERIAAVALSTVAATGRAVEETVSTQSAAAPAPTFIATYTPNKKASIELTELSLTLEEWGAHFAEYGHKDKGENGAVIFAVIGPCPGGFCHVGNPRRNCRGVLPHRRAENARAITALGLDYDGVTPEVMKQITDALKKRGVYFYFWETAGSTPTVKKFRIAIFFATPLPITNALQWRDVARPALMRYLGLPPDDPNVSDTCRLFYLPECPAGETREAWSHAGKVFDWRDVPGLHEEMNRVSVAIAVYVEAAKEDPTRNVDTEAIRAQFAKIKKPEIVAPLIPKVLRNEAPVAPPPPGGCRPKGDLSRRQGWLHLTCALANACEGHEHAHRETVLEIVRHAWRAEVEASAACGYPDDPTDWGEIEELFDGAMDSAASNRMAKKAVRERLAQALAAFRARRFGEIS